MKTLWDLNWDDVDPTRNAFSPEAIEVELEAYLRKLPLPPAQESDPWKWRNEGVDGIDLLFVARFGDWALGWRYSTDEGDPGGGVVKAWCCNEHSFFPEGYDESEVGDTAKAMVEGLVEWRSHLNNLARLFATLAPKAAGNSSQSLQLAVAEVVEAVIVATGCGDAWYGHAQQAVTWLLEATGIDPAQAKKAASEALSGRFESWTEPPTEAKNQAAARVAEEARKLIEQ